MGCTSGSAVLASDAGSSFSGCSSVCSLASVPSFAASPASGFSLSTSLGSLALGSLWFSEAGIVTLAAVQVRFPYLHVQSYLWLWKYTE